MDKITLTVVIVCGCLIAFLSYGLNNAKTQISTLKEAQSVANAQAIEQQVKTEFEWQQGLNDALDESNLELKNVELEYSVAVNDVNRMQHNATDDSNKQVPSSAATSCNVKQPSGSGRNTAGLRACEKSVLEFAKERDECAVKYNTLLKLYQQVQGKNNAD